MFDYKKEISINLIKVKLKLGVVQQTFVRDIFSYLDFI